MSNKFLKSKFKYHLKVKNGREIINEVNYDDSVIDVYGSGGVFKYTDRKLFAGPSVLFGRKGTIGKPLYVEGDFWTVDTMYYTEIYTGNSARYFYYLLEVFPWNRIVTQTALPSIVGSEVENYEINIPNENMQKVIAKYLDSKCEEINKLIKYKERLITFLEQQRQSIITEAVTKGLNPNVKMKDSGVEWIGEIPEHWEIKKVKHALNNLDYRRIPLSSEERGKMSEKTYDYYGASGVIDKVDNYLFDETLILIGEDGANLFSRSTPLAFLAKGKYWVNNHAHILKPKIGSIDYFVNLLESIDYSIYISGSAQPKLTQEALGNISILLPPIEEQFVIGDFVNDVLNEHSKVISMLNIQIEKLKEYRQALIYEAVTGKIDVRDMELD